MTAKTETIRNERDRLMMADGEVSSMYASASGCSDNYHDAVVEHVIGLRRFREAMALLVDGDGLPLSDAGAVERVSLHARIVSHVCTILEVGSPEGVPGALQDVVVELNRLRGRGLTDVISDKSTGGIAADPANPQPGEWLPRGYEPLPVGKYREVWDDDRPDRLWTCHAESPSMSHPEARYQRVHDDDPPAEPAAEGVWMSAAEARAGWVSGRVWLISDDGPAVRWGSDDPPLNSDYDDAVFMLVPEVSR